MSESKAMMLSIKSQDYIVSRGIRPHSSTILSHKLESLNMSMIMKL